MIPLNSDSNRDKVDVIDFIIATLREHEKDLDELTERLRSIVERAPAAQGQPLGERRMGVTVNIEDWEDFKAKGSGAATVAFQSSEDQLIITASKEGILYAYTERMPNMRIRAKRTEDRYVIEETSLRNPEDFAKSTATSLKCGLPTDVESTMVKLEGELYMVSINHRLDAKQTKAWLSNELKVQEKDVVRGEISLRS